MAQKEMVEVNGKVWGRLPSWEIREFDSKEDYEAAYTAEENEIADELFRLENEREVDDFCNDSYM